ncbi:MAG: hypothetical protein QF858_01390 [Candidatus Pacebacteria bacterium]|nr:hypothetical protein [Candidatus Paceibacterota bacterium]
MNETVKEQIKRKKKECAEALTNEKVEEPATDSPNIEEPSLKADASKPQIDVLDICPSSPSKKNNIAQGHVCIKIHSLGIEIRNIPYSISKDLGIKIQPPFKYHSFPEERGKPHKYVESIAFDDKTLWKAACEVIKAAVLEHHKEGISKAEEEKAAEQADPTDTEKESSSE